MNDIVDIAWRITLVYLVIYIINSIFKKDY
jgi:hypothetical protein